MHATRTCALDRGRRACMLAGAMLQSARAMAHGHAARAISVDRAASIVHARSWRARSPHTRGAAGCARPSRSASRSPPRAAAATPRHGGDSCLASPPGRLEVTPPDSRVAGPAEAPRPLRRQLLHRYRRQEALLPQPRSSVLRRLQCRRAEPRTSRKLPASRAPTGWLMPQRRASRMRAEAAPAAAVRAPVAAGGRCILATPRGCRRHRPQSPRLWRR